ncbi:MAG: CoA transferase [Burkholderiaceae bacterium]
MRPDPIVSHATPYAGLKVVDLSQGIAGPYCTMLLAQYGADVIKVETTGEGDWSRGLGARYGDHTAFSIVGNLGKRSVALDLKTDAGREALGRLIDDADVFIEGFRPGVVQRLGFGHEAVSARRPGIVYVSISGFGQTGPLAERPAMDPVLQAYTGLMMENRGADGVPMRMPVIVVDMATALYAFQALSAALYARRATGEGRYLDISLMQSACALQSIRLMQSHFEGGTIRPGGVPQGNFRTADGWMSIVAFNDRDFGKLCVLLDMPEAADDPRFATRAERFANQDALYAILRPQFAARTSDALDEALTRAQIMHERINAYAQFIEQPQVKATRTIQWLDQPGVPKPAPVPAVPGIAEPANGSPRGTSPARGQHTREVLAAHGYSAGEIERLLADGTAYTPPG